MLYLKSDTRCPECGSKSVRRSYRRRIEKVLLSLPICLPYRCKECWRRYYVFKKLFDTRLFHALKLNLNTNVNLFRLIAVVGTISIIFFIMIKFEDYASSLTKRASSPLPQHSFNLNKSEVSQESAAGVVMPVNVYEDSGNIQLEREMIKLKVAASWARESHFVNARPKFLLKKHEAVFIIDSTDGWYLVQHENGKQGWVNQSLF